jgi:hypothetical protein
MADAARAGHVGGPHRTRHRDPGLPPHASGHVGVGPGNADRELGFWTSKTDEIAAIGRGLAIVAGVAGLLENVVLHVWAGEPIQPGTSPPWSVQLAASLATLKWSALLPAAVVATVGVLVCLSRLIRYGLSRIPTGGRAAWETIGTALRMPTPREEASAALDDLPTEARGVKRLFYRSWGEPAEEKASPKRVNGVKEDREARWRQAYDVPSVTQERLQALNDGGHATGFALSGGGIRSGTLALGVLDSLRPELTAVDYLVSVSAGGYVAGAFAQALTGADTGFIPREVEPIRDPSSAFIQGTVELDHLRRHSSYIASTAPQLIVALGVLARGLLATLTLVYGPAVFLGAAAAWFYHMVPVVQLPTRRAEDMTTVLLIRDAAWWALALVTATAGSSGCCSSLSMDGAAAPEGGARPAGSRRSGLAGDRGGRGRRRNPARHHCRLVGE